MDKFPRLDRWFEIRLDVPNPHGYMRHDLCIRGNLTAEDWEALCCELALLVARLRLNSTEFQTWVQCCSNSKPIPENWKRRFRYRFWRSFVSDKATAQAQGNCQPDYDALQGYLGEIILYVIQSQYYPERIAAVPNRPKEYSKKAGIDCLEICGNISDPPTLHYIVWESKGVTSQTLEGSPEKIYREHLNSTPKSFGEVVAQLADLHADEPILSDFIDSMIDDFFQRRPTSKKCFGACVSYSSGAFPPPAAFAHFRDRFNNQLAGNPRCRQVRTCAAGDFKMIVCRVWELIWTRLLQ